MILFLNFNDDETRDYIHRQIIAKWEPFRRSEAEVGYGSKSPTVQPANISTTSTEGGAGYCKNCGEPYTSSQKFCGKCGKGLS